MPAPRRSDNWGFPRWGGYAGSRETVTVRLCDRHNCSEAGVCPAPKSPNNPDRWMFCQKHAAEYNSGWDYFEGLSKEDAEARQADETTTIQASAKPRTTAGAAAATAPAAATKCAPWKCSGSSPTPIWTR